MKTISGGRKRFPFDLTKSRKHASDLNFSKILIGDDNVTTSGILETISGGRKHFRLN